MNFNLEIKKLLESYSDEDKEIHIRGEYWFDEVGSPMYADGDYGDMNHEMYVEQRLTGEILNYFDLELDEFGGLDISDYYDQIKDKVLEDLIYEEGEDSEKVETFEDDFYYDPKQFIEDYIVSNFNEDRDKIIEMLYPGDARGYAIKNWGWSRVHGKHIEVNRLTSDTINLISKGIWNALEEEGLLYEEEDIIIAGESEYIISTYTGKRYTIKLDDMDSPENISNLEEEPLKFIKSDIINQLDNSALSDYYKGKPIGDSYKRDRTHVI